MVVHLAVGADLLVVGHGILVLFGVVGLDLHAVIVLLLVGLHHALLLHLLHLGHHGRVLHHGLLLHLVLLLLLHGQLHLLLLLGSHLLLLHELLLVHPLHILLLLHLHLLLVHVVHFLLHFLLVGRATVFLAGLLW